MKGRKRLFEDLSPQEVLLDYKVPEISGNPFDPSFMSPDIYATNNILKSFMNALESQYGFAPDECRHRIETARPRSYPRDGVAGCERVDTLGVAAKGDDELKKSDPHFGCLTRMR